MNTEPCSVPQVRFHRLITEGRPPQRADRSAYGTLPMRAVRHCEAVTTAAAYGWHVFPPIDVSFLWDGNDISWTHERTERWLPLAAAQFPGFAAAFDTAVPDAVRGLSPPFLTALPEPGTVQLWTGLLARTAPDWSLLVRAPANLPLPGGHVCYEGLLETDRWFGPLFVNLRLTRTSTPIRLRADFPLAQLQPVPRAAYAEATLAAMDAPPGLAALAAADWAAYASAVGDRSRGIYAAETRKRRKAEAA